MNAEQRREYMREWRAQNHARIRETDREYKKRNLERRRELYQEDPEKHRERSRRWAEQHPQKRNASSTQRYAKRLLLSWRNPADLEILAQHFCVTQTGAIYRRDTGEPAPLNHGTHGYRVVHIHAHSREYRGTFGVHNLVLALHGPAQPPGKTMVLHNDGDRTNNRLDNLRWGDALDNYRDAIRHGTLPAKPKGSTKEPPTAAPHPD